MATVLLECNNLYHNSGIINLLSLIQLSEHFMQTAVGGYTVLYIHDYFYNYRQKERA